MHIKQNVNETRDPDSYSFIKKTPVFLTFDNGKLQGCRVLTSEEHHNKIKAAETLQSWFFICVFEA